MIKVDPVLRAAADALKDVLSVPVTVEDPPDVAECVIVEYAPSSRPGTLGCVATDLAARIRVRGVARGIGAGRRAQALSEAAAAVLIETGVTGTGWETAGVTHIADSGADVSRSEERRVGEGGRGRGSTEE